MTDYSKWEKFASTLDITEEEEKVSTNNTSPHKDNNYQSLKEQESEIVKLQEKKKEFSKLGDFLTEMPKKLNHEVMIPFGKKAFTAGKIRHTNEILVHLGAEEYVWRTAEQAQEIRKRQSQRIEEELTRRLDVLEEKQAQVKTLLDLQQDTDFVDIREKEDETFQEVVEELDDSDIKKYFDIEEQEREKLEQQQQSCEEMNWESILDKFEQLETSDTQESQDQMLRQQGKAAFARKEYLKATELYSKALLTTEDKAIVYSNRSACMYRLQKFQESLQDAELAIRADEKYAKAFYRKAMAHKGLQQYEEAAKAFERASLLCPTDKSLQKQAADMKSQIVTSTTEKPLEPFTSVVLERSVDNSTETTESAAPARVSRFKAKRLAARKNHN